MINSNGCCCGLIVWQFVDFILIFIGSLPDANGVGLY